MSTPAKPRIHFIHLLNDRSGSPLVLSAVINAISHDTADRHVYTNSISGGVLSNLQGVNYHTIPYRWSNHKPMTLIYFLYSQLYLFMTLLFRINKKDIVYINTMLPFGAALAGKLRGVPVIWHIHETSVSPEALKSFLRKMIALTADQVVYVSRYLKQQEAFQNIKTSVVYNAVSSDFENAARKYYETTTNEGKNILMLCSLKAYKGIGEFVGLARLLPEITFELVINAKQEEISRHPLLQGLPANITIYESTADVHRFYKNARLVMNLSHPDSWIETFGMTILEAFHYGIPAIVPPVGGICELVDDRNGYRINSKELENIKERIELLYSDAELYFKMSTQALLTAQSFSAQQFTMQVNFLLHSYLHPKS